MSARTCGWCQGWLWCSCAQCRLTRPGIPTQLSPAIPLTTTPAELCYSAPFDTPVSNIPNLSASQHFGVIQVYNLVCFSVLATIYEIIFKFYSAKWFPAVSDPVRTDLKPRSPAHKFTF